VWPFDAAADDLALGPTIGHKRTRRGTISSKADMEAGSVAGNRRGHWHAAAVLVLTAGMLAPQPAHAQRAEGSFQRTVTVSGSPDVEVVSGSGSIEVRQGTAGRVEIAGRINANDSWGWRRSQLSAEERVKRLEGTPPVEQRGKTVRIGHIEQEELRDGVSISYVVTVPPGTTLRTTTGSGSQEIDVDGSVEAHSGSGSLRIRRAGGLRASTGSGSVTAESIDAATHVTTGSGSIRVTSAAGPVTAKTGSGGIEITQTGRGDVAVSSSSGTVRVRGVRGGVDASTSSGSLHIAGEMAADWRLSASSGQVTVDLPRDQRFDLDATSTSGSVDVGFPVTVTGRVERRSIRGPVGGGGPLLRVRTSSGGISIQ
jgi:hypothetical protein